MSPASNGDIARLSPESFARFADFITGELGIKMPQSKISMVQSRLLRRVRELGFDSVERYSQYFFESEHAAAERTHLINAITTNKTDFFREPQHFEYLVDTVLPQYHEERVRVWSAGCSSGEEPYTLAMILNEYARVWRSFEYSVLATDVSTRVLERAQAGIYDESAIAPIAAELRSRYLLRSRDRGQNLVRMVPALRARVQFRQLNFMDASYPLEGLFEVVFFRNVMIYYDRPTQEAVIRKICRHLAPGGYLFVGHSESLAGLDIPAEQVHLSVFRKDVRR